MVLRLEGRAGCLQLGFRMAGNFVDRWDSLAPLCTHFPGHRVAEGSARFSQCACYSRTPAPASPYSSWRPHQVMKLRNAYFYAHICLGLGHWQGSHILASMATATQPV